MKRHRERNSNKSVALDSKRKTMRGITNDRKPKYLNTRNYRTNSVVVRLGFLPILDGVLAFH